MELSWLCPPKMVHLSFKGNFKHLRSFLNFFQNIIYIVLKKCLSFYALFCLFFSFSQLHSPLCAFEKLKNTLKKFYKNFKDIN